MLKQFLLVTFLIVLFLLADVLADCALIDSHCRHEVSTCPEVVSLEALMPAHEIACRPNRSLALDVPHDLRHRILGRNPNHHMHMIRAQMAFGDLVLPLLGSLVENLPQVLSNLAVEHFTATFRDENDVVLALPFGVV